MTVDGCQRCSFSKKPWSLQKLRSRAISCYIFIFLFREKDLIWMMNRFYKTLSFLVMSLFGVSAQTFGSSGFYSAPSQIQVVPPSSQVLSSMGTSSVNPNANYFLNPTNTPVNWNGGMSSYGSSNPNVQMQPPTQNSYQSPVYPACQCPVSEPPYNNQVAIPQLPTSGSGGLSFFGPYPLGNLRV